ncbi:protein kinase domain-containing protein [Endozoicomonas lisbonensis]|uniref:protein kinase domain-containing protein n=1 Tax=Endozoicomonas lisbonensis TaxID=3120522 RepID=UPI0033992326
MQPLASARVSTEDYPLTSRPVFPSQKAFKPFQANNLTEALKQSGLEPVGKVLGKGAFATVEEYKHHDHSLAVKIITKKAQGEFEKGEIEALRISSHPNIAHTHAILLKKTDGNSYALIDHTTEITDEIKQGYQLAAVISDKVSGTELFDLLNTPPRIRRENKMVIDWTSDIAEALNHIQQHGVVFRDLKPENVLISTEAEERIAILVDFGLSKKIGLSRTRSFRGTYEYIAPEVWQCKLHEDFNYSYSVDSWALGSLIFEFITDFPPSYCVSRNNEVILQHRQPTIREWKKNTDSFAELDDEQKIKLMKKGTSKLWVVGERPAPELMELAAGLLRRNPVERLTIQQASEQLLRLKQPKPIPLNQAMHPEASA